MSYELIKGAIAGSAIVAFVALGVTSEQLNKTQEATLRQRHAVAPEFIQTRGLESPSEFLHVTSGKLPSTSSYWVMAETEDWLLLNGPRGTATCQGVLGTFGYVNAPEEAQSLASMRMLVAGYKGKPLELQVVVPRFKEKPANLDDCLGFQFDAESGRLKVGDKYLAYLHPQQPRLAGTVRD